MGFTTVARGWIDWKGSGYTLNQGPGNYPKGLVSLSANGQAWAFKGYPAAIVRHVQKYGHVRAFVVPHQGAGRPHLTIKVSNQTQSFANLYAKEIFWGPLGPLGIVSSVAPIAPAAVLSVDAVLGMYDAVGPNVDRVSSRPSRFKAGFQKLNPNQTKTFVQLEWGTPPGENGLSLFASRERPLYFHELARILTGYFKL